MLTKPVICINQGLYFVSWIMWELSWKFSSACFR